MSDVVDNTNVLLDEERRVASHQEVKASIDNDVNARIKQESTKVDPKEAAQVADVAQDLKAKSVDQAASTEREVGRGRAAARISQVVDYVFFVIYGLIVLEIVLGLIGALRQRLRSVHRLGHEPIARSFRSHCRNTDGRIVSIQNIVRVRTGRLHIPSSRDQWHFPPGCAPQGNSIASVGWGTRSIPPRTSIRIQTSSQWQQRH
jgi:hypothetical protein